MANRFHSISKTDGEVVETVREEREPNSSESSKVPDAESLYNQPWQSDMPASFAQAEVDDIERQFGTSREAMIPPPPPAWRRDRGQSTVPIRQKHAVDIVTGNLQQHSCLCQPIYSDDYYQPMDPGLRWWKKFVRGCRKTEYDPSSPVSICQYRLTSQRSSNGFWSSLKIATEEEFRVAQGLRILVAQYLHWTFRNSFLLLFLTVTFFYVIGIMIFAILIYLSGRHIPYCITVGSEDFDSSGHFFIDAVSLSWNSFSTVGYGATYPSLESASGASCIGINMLTAMESFAGIIFVGFVGAVVYSKVARIQSVATVEFSDPIVVRYGTGLAPVLDTDDKSDASSHGELPNQAGDHNPPTARRSLIAGGGKIPCPILEFRVVNRMHDQAGGEICNANIKVVASTLASRASPVVNAELRRGRRASCRELFGDSIFNLTYQNEIQPTDMLLMYQSGEAALDKGTDLKMSLRSGGGSFRRSFALRKTIGLPTLNEEEEEDNIRPPPEVIPNASLRSEFSQQPTPKAELMPLPVSVVHATRRHVAVDEEPSAELIPRLIFSKLDIESDQHPFFKRVWNIRHILNESSPLLSSKAKRLVEQNGGFWPEELNSYKHVRKHIHFHQIIASFYGTANVSGSAVYAQKVYGFDGMNVGYHFAEVLYKNPEGNIGMDLSLLNDVTEQWGGGAEPFQQGVGDTDVISITSPPSK